MKGVCRLALVAPLLILAAPVEAAANLRVSDILLADEDGDLLRIGGEEGPIVFRVLVNNTGDTATNGSARVRVTVALENGTTVFTGTASVPVGLAPGNSTTVEVTWSAARRTGNHTATATVEGFPQSGFQLNFLVAKTPVRAGDLVDRILQYAWLWGAFVLGVVLYGVALAARKR